MQPTKVMFSTPHTAKLLTNIMELQGWSQFDLAARAGVHRATVGQHLNLTRTVRDEHLIGYLQAVPTPDVPRLTAAWLHDLLHTRRDLLGTVLDTPTGALQKDAAAWAPSLSDPQRTALEFWAHSLPTDPELSQLFDLLTRRARGHQPSDHSGS